MNKYQIIGRVPGHLNIDEAQHSLQRDLKGLRSLGHYVSNTFVK